MKTLTITISFAGMLVRSVVDYLENTVGVTVLGVVVNAYGPRRNVEIVSNRPKLTRFDVTLTENGAIAFAEFLNRTVDELERDFAGEWRSL
jgi:hypothetical protein